MAAGSSDEEDEDLVTVGTPLELLEEGERIKKPVPLQDQTVKDEKGRYKRFHGAFSGGFSAGYFNTVGSKEGWAPSAFVSSRQNRAETKVLEPEDFMDEEDLGEHGIAPKEITITDAFASQSKDKIQEKARQLAGIVAPIPGATVLDEFITPAKITIGIDLLRKMGWKEGQGVGPRVKRKPRKQKPEPGVKIYGCALPPGSEDSEEEEDEYQPENVTFAPKDVMPVDLTPKENLHGLGYKGLDPNKALFGTSEEPFNLFSLGPGNLSHLGDVRHGKGRKLGISGQAFGVGALEEEDEDIYTVESLSKYDSVLKDEEPGDGLYGWTAPHPYKSKPGREKEKKYLGKILDGFYLASKSITPAKTYPPPDLPRDYRPIHYFRPVIKATAENSHLLQALAESTGKLLSDTAIQSRHQKTASERREVLGETALKGPTASVLEYLSDKDKERIQEVKQAIQPQRKADTVPQQSPYNKPHAPPASDVPRKWQLMLGSQLSTTGSTDFKPFASNPEKQKRYEHYLENLACGKKDVPESCLDASMTEWERGREREEFSRAAAFYKTSSSILSSRFTTAKLEDDTDKVDVPRDEETNVDDKAAAAKMKMFGKLTREKFEWHPDKLLCKRFNIPDPYAESCIVGLPTVKRDKYSVFNFLTVASESASGIRNQPTKTGVQQDNVPNKPKKSSRWDVPDKEKKKDTISEFISLARSKIDVPEQLPKAIEEKAKHGTSDLVPTQPSGLPSGPSEAAVEEESRPSMDLFKAIFASSSDDTSSSEEESEGEEPAATALEGESKNPKPCDSPGVPLPVAQETEVTPEIFDTITPTSKEVVDQGEFGPRLPPVAYSGTAEVVAEQKPQKIKEKHKRKEHKHKKEKKKKHKKSKHKGKHKNKKSEKNSSSDTAESRDSSSEEGKTNISPQELLRRMKNFPLVKW
ncbi:G patch domain-containing protein 1 isoform X2 [Notechis scutatus]|uniref:G patch domain-containing protein 1 isoform X2 n=1 Tax=Notechis scutatus TaxID=8663 RepID=A0A6J1UMY6_9SAUR|nr:G patch domain-containing protein 1 isoform X2 [Notechis scutatus]